MSWSNSRRGCTSSFRYLAASAPSAVESSMGRPGYPASGGIAVFEGIGIELPQDSETPQGLRAAEQNPRGCERRGLSFGLEGTFWGIIILLCDKVGASEVQGGSPQRLYLEKRPWRFFEMKMKVGEFGSVGSFRHFIWNGGVSSCSTPSS